jgi:hypothetical protein
MLYRPPRAPICIHGVPDSDVCPQCAMNQFGRRLRKMSDKELIVVLGLAVGCFLLAMVWQ